MDDFANRLAPAAAFLARRAHLVALALFAIVGVSILEDYGIANDEGVQREIGIASFDYILGDEDALPKDVDRYYGVAFEVPLIAVERAFGLGIYRGIDLSRRLITHLFFLIGGFFAWLLAYRLFGSRLAALFAMLLFLLHPRLYAHSFFNTKDLPFLSMFMVALYLTHRAFRRDSVWAFALCGAGAGLLANMRIVGVMMIPAVLGLLALDAFHAMRRGGWSGMKPALANAGAFFGAFAVVLYAAWPLLWRDPTELVDAFQVMSRHTTHALSLFRGEPVRYPNVPWDFIPTWILITTPPVALMLTALGIAAVVRLCAADWRGMLANATARFGALMVAFLILPVAAVIALNSNLYNDWRQMFFLYAPMCVLAAFGLNLIMELVAAKPRLRAAACGLVALGIALAVVQMVRLHPYQQDYFNPLVGKSDIADRWTMNYWRIFHKEALDALLEIQPSGQIAVMSPGYYRFLLEHNMKLFSEEERSRLVLTPNFPSFIIVAGDGGDGAIWKREVYGVPFGSIIDARAESEALFRDTYAAARASAPSARGGGWNVYADGETLTYIKEGCAESDARGRFWVSVFPSDPAVLHPDRRAAGFEHDSLNFDFPEYGAVLDGGCVIIRELPGYPIGGIEMGQSAPGEGELWRARITLE